MTEEIELKLPIKWIFPRDQESKYATNMIVQSSKSEFTISFFEIRRPIVLGTLAEQAEQAAKLDSVDAICVARIIVTADRFPAFIKALSDNWESYRVSYGEDTLDSVDD